MNPKTPSLLLCATLLLAACGGGSSTVSAPPVNEPPVNDPDPGASQPPPGPPGAEEEEPPAGTPVEDPDGNEGNDDEGPVPNDRPYVINYYGDSTIWGWASGTGGARVATPAPDAFAAALPTPPENVVRNEGVSGTTACDLLEGTDGVHPQWSEEMAQSDATHVILNHGINDRKSYDLGRYRSCLGELARIARAHGKEVVFETPNPITSEGLGDYVQVMHEVALAQQPDVPVIDQHAYLLSRLGGASVSDIVPDGEHPDQATYIVKGEYAATRFTALYPR